MGGNTRRLRPQGINSAEVFVNALTDAGAIAVGFAEAAMTDSRDLQRLSRWLTDGHAADMDYMHNHLDLRADPRAMLDGAKTVVCAAFPYNPRVFRKNSLSHISAYAYGSDYHDVIRKRVRKALKSLKEHLGGEYRICIDSAPVLERYWAQKSGLGERCDNGLICVPGYGTRVFLCEILTTLDITPANNESDMAETTASAIPSQHICLHCGACRNSCPARALQIDGTVDARRCLSYLTIEHRGDWDEIGLQAMNTPAGRKTLYGCDICQNVCPLNRNVPPSHIEEFSPSEILLSIDAKDVADISAEDFAKLFKNSPIKRTGAAGISRNARNILNDT